jgi:hypothetical protein
MSIEDNGHSKIVGGPFNPVVAGRDAADQIKSIIAPNKFEIARHIREIGPNVIGRYHSRVNMVASNIDKNLWRLGHPVLASNGALNPTWDLPWFSMDAPKKQSILWGAPGNKEREKLQEKIADFSESRGARANVQSNLEKHGLLKRPEQSQATAALTKEELDDLLKQHPILGRIRDVQNRLLIATGGQGLDEQGRPITAGLSLIQQREANSGLNRLTKQVNSSFGDPLNHIKTYNFYIKRYNETMGAEYPLLSNGASMEELSKALKKVDLYPEKRHLTTHNEFVDKLYQESRTVNEEFAHYLRSEQGRPLQQYVAPKDLFTGPRIQSGAPVKPGSLPTLVSTNGRFASSGKVSTRKRAKPTAEELSHRRIDPDSFVGMDYDELFDQNGEPLFSNAGDDFTVLNDDFYRRFFVNESRGAGHGSMFGMDSLSSEYGVGGVKIHSRDSAKSLEDFESKGHYVKKIGNSYLDNMDMANIARRGRHSTILDRATNVAFAERPAISTEEAQSWVGRIIYERGSSLPSRVVGITDNGMLQIAPVYDNLKKVSAKYSQENFQDYFKQNVMPARTKDTIASNSKLAEKTIASGGLSDDVLALKNDLLGASSYSLDARLSGSYLPSVLGYMRSSPFMINLMRNDPDAAQDAAQNVSLALIQFAPEWLQKHPNLEKVSYGVLQDFNKDFRRWVPSHMLDAEMGAKADKLDRAYRGLRKVAPLAKTEREVQRLMANFRDADGATRTALAPLIGLGSKEIPMLVQMLNAGNPLSIDAQTDNGEGEDLDNIDRLRVAEVGPSPEQSVIQKENQKENAWQMSEHDYLTPEGQEKLARITRQHKALATSAPERGRQLAAIEHEQRVWNRSARKQSNSWRETVASDMLGNNEERLKIQKTDKFQQSLGEQIQLGYDLAAAKMHTSFEEIGRLMEAADVLKDRGTLGHLFYDNDLMSVVSTSNGVVTLKSDTTGKLRRLGAGENIRTFDPADLSGHFNYRGSFDEHGLLIRKKVPLLRDPDGPFNYFSGSSAKIAHSQSVLQNLDTMAHIKEGQKVTVLDIETTTSREAAARAELATGSGSDLFAVTQIAAKEYEMKGGQLSTTGRQFNQFIKPDQGIVKFAHGAAGRTDMTEFQKNVIGALGNVGGIDNLVAKGQSKDSVMGAFQSWLPKDPNGYILGQNLDFDIGNLTKEGIDFGQVRTMDTQALGVIMNMPKTSLEYMVENFADEATRAAHMMYAHEAGNDVDATVNIFNRLRAQAVAIYRKAPKFNVGDYLVQFHGKRQANISPENTRGVLRITGFNSYADKLVLNMERMDTREGVSFEAANHADLENLAATRFHSLHGMGAEQREELSDQYVGDRAARMASKMSSVYGNARYYEKRMEAMRSYTKLHNEAYPEIRGNGLRSLTNLSDEGLLGQMDQGQADILRGLTKSEMVGSQAMYPWYMREYRQSHMDVVHGLSERVDAGELTPRQAAREFHSYNDELTTKYPTRFKERPAEVYEQGFQIHDGKKNYDILTGRRQWSESTLHSYLNDKVRNHRKNGDPFDEAEFKLSLMHDTVLPQLRSQGLVIPGLDDTVDDGTAYRSAKRPTEAQMINMLNDSADGHMAPKSSWLKSQEARAATRSDASFVLRDMIQRTAVALGNTQLDNTTVRYEDVLSRRDGPRKYLVDAQAQGEKTLEAGPEAAGAAEEAVAKGASAASMLKQTTEVSPGMLNDLGRALERTATGPGERFTMFRSLGIETASRMAHEMLQRPWVKKALPAALSLPLAYLAFQMVRGDDLNMGKATPQTVAGNQTDDWMRAPNMSGMPGMSGPQAAIHFPSAPSPGHYRISATDPKPSNSRSEEVSAAVNQSLNSSMPVPVNLKTQVTDNTNNMGAAWWTRNILDYIF